MMRKKIDHRECDNCGKVAEQKDPVFGGSPFINWFSVNKASGHTHYPQTIIGPWDFCSVDCTIKFLENNYGKV